MLTLICCKTGRFWKVRDPSKVHRIAAILGLKDYEIEEAVEQNPEKKP